LLVVGGKVTGFMFGLLVGFVFGTTEEEGTRDSIADWPATGSSDGEEVCGSIPSPGTGTSVSPDSSKEFESTAPSTAPMASRVIEIKHFR